MDISAFRASLRAAAPPDGLAPAPQALWWDAKGDWDRAHALAQADEGGAGDWVHAYLHRKQGYAGNADYWYRRAGEPRQPRRGMGDDRRRAARRRTLSGRRVPSASTPLDCVARHPAARRPTRGSLLWLPRRRVRGTQPS
jgi:hypothetical protein